MLNPHNHSPYGASPSSYVPPPPPPPPPHSQLSQASSPIVTSPSNTSSQRQRDPRLNSQPTTPSPYSPQASQSPMSRVEYNPQQWGRGGPTGGAFVPHSAYGRGQSNDPEAGDVNPPPPYSPPNTEPPPHSAPSPIPPAPRSNSLRPMLPTLQTHMPHLRPVDAHTPMSAVTLVTPHSSIDPNNLRSALTPLSSVTAPLSSFPPPPSRDRSGSRSNKSRFGLSALARGLSSDRSGSHAEPAVPPIPREHSRNNAPDPQRRPTQTSNHTSNRSSVYIAPSAPIYPAPATRRSASAGPSPSVNGPPNLDWNQVPPPPPPLPADSRSSGNQEIPTITLPTRRPRQPISTLETIPPTPAGWDTTPQTDSSSESTPVAPISQPGDEEESERSYTTGSSEHLSHADGSSSNSNSSSSTFRRIHERRDSTVKGIRERRNESRATKDRLPEQIDESNAPTDLKLNLSSPSIIRQGAVKKGKAGMSPRESPNLSMRVTGRRSVNSQAETPSNTSPLPSGSSYTPRKSLHNALGSAGFTDTPTTAPPGSARSLSRNPGKAPIPSIDTFARESLERHQEFVNRERLATSESEKLEIFAAYIVDESRIRRKRYSDAFASMSASDILDLTRDLWRKLDPKQLPPVNTSDSTQTSQRPISNRTESFGSMSSSPMSSRTNPIHTPRTDSESPQDNTGTGPGRDSAFRQYQPVLSPIPSMAMSTAPEGRGDGEEDSRGRSRSRWWESDSGSAGAGRKIERSARESKYMGLHPDARFNLQYEDALGSATPPARAGPSSAAHEYPPEKVGWHEPEPTRSKNSAADQYEDYYSNTPQGQIQSPPQYLPPSSPAAYASVPPTPSATVGLDVSRLVTLPPPYPRHYPAMSNAHPELAQFRATIRSLNDNSELNSRKTAFEAKISRQKAIRAQESMAREAQLRQKIQEQVSRGTMSYTQAAREEDEFAKREVIEKGEDMRRIFDAFGPDLQTPLNALFQERIVKANQCVIELRKGLGTSEVDAPMEEGDERPEVLERLKLVKWLVEARENAHRGIFDLETQRSGLFREMVLEQLVQRQASQEEVRSTEAFFMKDTRERAAKFEVEARGRWEELQGVVQKYVDRSVQDQLSAFWDIAPRLSDIVQKIPERTSVLRETAISIPHKEIDENRVYKDFPLQYLFGLLCHAEKSTYQFIENQVGLMCLAHEVGLALMGAGIRVLKASRCVEEGLPENDQGLEREMQEVARFEEQRLTRELKEKVSEVEGQWEQALGKDLKKCSGRVELVLQETGGWDDSLKE